jgi:hypothetical protein
MFDNFNLPMRNYFHQKFISKQNTESGRNENAGV